MNHITKASNKCLDLIKSFEGFYSSPYLCPAKVATIGYGTTYYPDGKRVTLSDPPIDEVMAATLLQSNLANYERGVDAMTRDDITQNQFDALVSFAYNVGLNNLKNSTLLKLVNANPNNKNIRKEFLKWVHANGKKLKGLERRRQAEAELYFILKV